MTTSSPKKHLALINMWNYVLTKEWENYEGVIEKHDTHPCRQKIQTIVQDLVRGQLEETLTCDELIELAMYKEVFSWEASYSMEVEYNVYCSDHFTDTIDLDEDEFKAHIMDEELEVEEPDLADACYQGEIEIHNDGECGSRFYHVHLCNFKLKD